MCAFSSSPDLSLTLTRRDRFDDFSGHHLDAALREGVHGVVPDVRLEHREDLRPGFDEHDPSRVRADVRVVLAEEAGVELSEGSGGLDARRAPADDDDVQRPVVDQRRILVRGLPQAQDLVLEPDRVGERVQREGVLGGALDAEEVDLRAETEDEVVVAQRLQFGELHLTRVEVDRGHAILVEARVLLVVEEVTDRMADRRLLQQARRDLVQEGLERVVVVLVDEHDVDVALVQLLGGADSGEAAAEDEDALAGAVRVVSSAHVPSHGTARPSRAVTPSG